MSKSTTFASGLQATRAHTSLAPRLLREYFDLDEFPTWCRIILLLHSMKNSFGTTIVTSTSVDRAFQECERLARTHYENFPVASFFLPKDLRPSIAAVYAFARTADDFADEEYRSIAERLDLLNDWHRQLDECYQGNASHPIFIALAEVVDKHRIPQHLFVDLLTAFKMDVMTNRFSTFNDLLHYCSYSATPVGRIVLLLFDDTSEQNRWFSDKICTALQLTNFWQDVSIDLQKNRIYIPLEDIERFGYTENKLVQRMPDEPWTRLMEFEVERTKSLFDEGRPLLSSAPRDLRFELNLTWKGGRKILERIEQNNYNVLSHRPTISFAEKLSLLVSAFLRTP